MCQLKYTFTLIKENLISNSIAFVLMSRYPSNKAYCVTTSNTADAALSFGYTVKILTPRKDLNLDSNITVTEMGRRIHRVLLEKNYKITLKIRFSLFLFVYAFIISKKCRATVFWTRDIFFSLILSSLSQSKIVCEIHHQPTFFERICLRLLHKNKNVIIAPISKSIAIKNWRGSKNIVLAPMSVNEEDMIDLNQIGLSKSNDVFYIGNESNVGSSSILNLINETALILSHTKLDLKFNLIGFNEEFYSNSVVRNKSPNVILTGQIPRSKVIKHLNKGGIGLLLYPESQSNAHVFPIKTVEYAAAGLAIIASDTKNHRSILDENSCLFFDGMSPESLSSSVIKLATNETLRISLASGARLWVSAYTYTNRFKNIDEMLELFSA